MKNLKRKENHFLKETTAETPVHALISGKIAPSNKTTQDYHILSVTIYISKGV